MKFKFIFGLMIVLLLVGTVSADLVKFDNFQKFDRTYCGANENSANGNCYGKYEIYDRPIWWVDIGSKKLREVELISNTENCGRYCEAVGTTTLYEEGTLMDSVRFERVWEDGSRTDTKIRSYDVYIKNTPVGYNEVDKYETQCNSIDKTGANGTYTVQECEKVKVGVNLVPDYGMMEVNDYEEQCEMVVIRDNGDDYYAEEICTPIVIGTHLEEAPEWKLYDGSDLPEGSYEWKIEGEKDPDDVVDWIGSWNGIEGTEWAIWGTLGPNEGLRMYFKMDESSGTVLTDTTGNFNGTITNGNLQAEGIINGSHQYNGIDKYDSIASDPYWEPSTNTFSLSYWVYDPDPTTDSMVLGSYDGAGAGVFINNRIGLTSGKLAWTLLDTGGSGITNVDSSSSIASNTWVNIVWVVNRETDRAVLYINGTEEINESIAGVGSFSNVNEFAFGRVRTGVSSWVYFDGRIDEVGWWNKSLTEEEISQLYNGGVPSQAPWGDAEVTLISPEDDTIYLTEEVEFNCSASVSSGATITNMSLFTNASGTWEIDQSIIGSEEFISENSTGVSSHTSDSKAWGKIKTINIANRNVNYLRSTYACATGGQSCTFYVKYFYTNGSTYQTPNFGVGGTSGTELNKSNPNANSSLVNKIEVWGQPNAFGPITCQVWGSYVYSYRLGNSANENVSFTKTITEPTLWTCQACDSDGDCGFATENRTVSVDVTPPIINITYPVNGSSYIDQSGVSANIELNWTTTDASLDTCWYYNQTANVTVTCGTNATFILPYGTYTHIVYANDTLGNQNSTEVTATYDTLIFENSQTYSNATVSGSLEDFYANVTISPTIEISSATLIYNENSSASGSFTSSGQERIISVENFEIPVLPAAANVSFYWSLLLTDSSIINLTTQTQEVSIITVDNCSVGTNQLLEVNLFDEELMTSLLGDIEFYFEVQNKPSYNTIQNISSLYENVSNLNICSDINLTDSNLAYSVEIRYSSDDYAPELYHIQKQDIDGEIVNLSLYDLALNDSTEFTLEYQNEEVIKIDGAVIQLQRKYISENLYRTVEAPLTGEGGKAIVHVDLNTNKYRAVVVKDGVVLDIFENIVFECENELSGICDQNLFAPINPQNSVGITQLNDFAYSISETNGTVTTVFSVPSGVPATVNIQLKQTDQFGNETLCNQTIISSSGSIDCTYQTTIGESYLSLDILKNGDPQAKKTYIIPEAGAIDFFGNNFFIVFIFLISILGMAFTSPEWIIINSVITMLVAGSLWLLSGLSFVMGLGGLMWLIVAAAILIMKIAKQEDR